ncbi:hypothetical protein S245_055075, partial [Arachis hypogaea]
WSASLESALCYGWDSVDAQKMEYRSWARLPSIANCRWRRVCSQNNSNQLQTWRIKVNVYNELHRMCKEIDEKSSSSANEDMKHDVCLNESMNDPETMKRPLSIAELGDSLYHPVGLGENVIRTVQSEN